MIIHSPLNYVGGKYKIMQYLLLLFPKNINRFIDLCCGGLNVSINVKSQTVYANDIYTPVIDIYRFIQSYDNWASLNQRIFQIIQDYDLDNATLSQNGYLRLRNDYNKTKDIGFLLVLSFYSFNNYIRFNHNNEFNTSYGKGLSYNYKKQEQLKTLYDIIKTRNFIFSDLSFQKFDYSILDENDFVYVDPPYLITDAVYNEKRNDKTGWNEQEQRLLYDFLDKLNERNIKFGVSNLLFHHGKTNQILDKWRQQYFSFFPDIQYNLSTYAKEDRTSDSIEIYVTNYDSGHRDIIQENIF